MAPLPPGNVWANSLRQASKSAMNFLWTTFTRFEPAADLHAQHAQLLHNTVSYTPPVVIDARMKPGYPKELFCDPDTAAKVERRWREYLNVAPALASRAATVLCVSHITQNSGMPPKILRMLRLGIV